ncbi:hypothetical protein AUC43_16390 [Hymenobacter sedentarius]|uniref:Phytase-like domain-containing protein n=1 Tax=Hymenobacter sedentarius TaxID=1411621 RepID=A0A0U4BS44_9BACT|nr:hypothetical protein [Hymenobacter sedentarius]ALW86522.1 hypothetical protein AUC43_16390 [Hymenobacter sedentarius]
MTATVLAETSIAGLPSASGIELIGPVAYVISDDAPFVYLLDAATLAVTGQVRLFESAEFGSGRIPKKTKADAEALTALTWPDGAAGVLVLGSGSTPLRETGWFVPVAGGAAQPVALAPLYALLRAHLPAGARLNVEAAASSDTELLLFQRTTEVANGALMFRLPLAATLQFLACGGPAPGVAAPLSFELPHINGRPAGFSGASFVHERLFVSASVEETKDSVLDGQVLGSFIGVLDEQHTAATFARLVWADGRAYIGKVEGLAVRRTLEPNRWELLLVTDDDAGGSTAVVAEVAMAE